MLLILLFRNRNGKGASVFFQEHVVSRQRVRTVVQTITPDIRSWLDRDNLSAECDFFLRSVHRMIDTLSQNIQTGIDNIQNRLDDMAGAGKQQGA